MSSTANETTTQAQDYEATYQAQLAEAIRALTDAARLPRPQLRRTDEGTWVEDTQSAAQQTGWAEFVTVALAGAAANLGGIDAVLAGRSGSWEVEGVRKLLYSTVGADEAQLWTHRTDPLEITLCVNELLIDRAYEAIEQYNAAEDEISRRSGAAYDWDVDDAQYKWVYDRTESSELVPRDPAAPAWSWDAWRAGLDPDSPEDYRQAMEESLRTGVGLFTGRFGDATVAYLSKSPELDAEFDRLVAEHEGRIAAIAELEERLHQQRICEWTAYGEALKARIETTAAATPGLDVPVCVTVDAETHRLPANREEGVWNSLESRLVDAAALDTPTPADLPGTPLERLEQQ